MSVLSFIRPSTGLVAAIVIALGALPAGAVGTVDLGDGVALAYNTGALDPATLAGTAEGITVTVDGDPVATIARLALETRGSIAEAGFTIIQVEAGGIAAIDDSARLAGATGRDLPLGSLRALAREMETLESPDFSALAERLSQISFGTLALTGFEGEDARAHVTVARIAADGGGEGQVATVEITDAALTDKEDNVQIRLKAARLEGLSFKTRAAAAFAADGLTISGSMLDVAMAAVRYTAETRLLDGGVPYSAHSALTITDLKLKPGLAPDPELAAFFKDLGEDGVTLQIEAKSDGEPQGANLDMGSTFTVTAQTGDALDISGRAQVPIVMWQLFNEAITRAPADVDPDSLMQILASTALVHGEIAITAGRLADTLLEAAARDSGMTPAEMRAMMAEEADGALGALPGGGEGLRAAIRGFIARSGTLRLALKPVYPIPLTALMTADEQMDALWSKLQITAIHTER